MRFTTPIEDPQAMLGSVDLRALEVLRERVC